MTDWMDLTRRAAFASHRLVGWIYWDPVAIAHYAALGPEENWVACYSATRGASLAPVGNGAVIAAFHSVHPDVVALSLDGCREHTTFEEAAKARDAGVVDGLHTHVPEICDGLADLR